MGSIFSSMKHTIPRISAERAAKLQRVLRQSSHKAKASVSLSGNLLHVADAIAGKAQRSALVERAVRRYLTQLLRQVRDERDVAVIAAGALLTNRESDELLDIQVWPE